MRKKFPIKAIISICCVALIIIVGVVLIVNNSFQPEDSQERDLSELAKEKQVEYLDVASALRGPDGALPADASADGVHLKTPYLQKWCDYLIANANP